MEITEKRLSYLQKKFENYFINNYKIESTDDFWAWLYNNYDKALKDVIKMVSQRTTMRDSLIFKNVPIVHVCIGGLSFKQVGRIVEEIEDFAEYLTYLQQDYFHPQRGGRHVYSVVTKFGKEGITTLEIELKIDA